ncbi:M48 family metallopeptidase [Archangium violaceum]|uniref:M48 family metallopeptidase n=1 Tax=Archangium violaceum TaxID=83451 RepID=UPI0036DC9B12
MSRWPGKLLDASSPEGRTDCEIELRDDALVALLPEGREVALPLPTLALQRQGYSRDILAFHTAGTQQPWITTRDPAILAALKQHPRGSGVLGQEREQRWKSWVNYAVRPIATCVVLALVGTWFVLGPLVGLALAAIPTSVDVKLGEVSFASSLEQLGGTEVHDARVVEPVRQLLEPLVAQVPKEHGYQFELHVVRSDMVNAFALPGGKLVVTTGLLREAVSAESVTGVLAHEVAHVTARHSMRSLLKQVGLWALMAAVFGDVSGASAIVLQQAASLSSLSFSRDMELEADRNGLEMLRTAGQDPQGLRVFLQSLSAQEKDLTLPAFLSTHPMTEERISTLESLAAAQGPVTTPRPVTVDFKALQAALPE